MEGVQTLPAAAEQEDEEDVAENTEDGNHQQHHSLDVELEEVGKLVVRVTGRHPARLGVLRGVTESWGEREEGGQPAGLDQVFVMNVIRRAGFNSTTRNFLY